MIGRVAAGVVVGFGALYLGIGPQDDAHCNDQSSFESWFYGDRLGHVDGADFTGCMTPTAGAYALDAAIGLAAFGVASLVGRSWDEGRRYSGRK